MDLNPHVPIAPALFAGREEIMRELLAKLPDRRFYGLHGGKGMGKTSLLQTLQHRLAENKNPAVVYLSCEWKDSAEQLVRNIVDAMCKAAGVSDAIVREAEKAAGRKDLGKALDLVLDFLFERDKEAYAPIVLLDNVHRISANKIALNEIDSIFNKLVGNHQLGLLMAGRNSVSDAFNQEGRDDSPLPGLLSGQHELTPFALSETEALIRSMQAEIKPEFIKEVQRMSGGHPFRLFFYLDKLGAGKSWTVKALKKQDTDKNKKHLEMVLGRNGRTEEKQPVKENEPKENESLLTRIKALFFGKRRKKKPDSPLQRLGVGFLAVLAITGLLWVTNTFIAPLPPMIVGAAVLLSVAALLSIVVFRIAFGLVLGSVLLLLVVVGAFEKLETEQLSEAGFIVSISKVLDKLGLVFVGEPSNNGGRQNDSVLAEYAALKKLTELQVGQNERGIVVTLGDVFFVTAKADLLPDARSDLKKLAGFLQLHPRRKISIEGHADSQGEPQKNLLLSKQRAEAVKSALLALGVEEPRMTVLAHGESKPIADNDSETGRQRNRRVEIVVN
ncbi:MAG: OmpA family protein [Gammaproteobacteria bacterium]|nr:OmpA family protein [Gammaproteobacteria bacterium]